MGCVNPLIISLLVSFQKTVSYFLWYENYGCKKHRVWNLMWGTSATGEFEHARAARLSDLRYLRNEWDYDVRCNGVASLSSVDSSVDSSAGISSWFDNTRRSYQTHNCNFRVSLFVTPSLIPLIDNFGKMWEPSVIILMFPTQLVRRCVAMTTSCA